MAILGKIRRMHGRDKLSLRDTTERTDLSRTLTKLLISLDNQVRVVIENSRYHVEKCR